MDQKQIDFYYNSEAYFNLLFQGDEEYFNEYITFVKYYVPVGSYILDAGCGTGQSTSLLNKQGYKVKGLDGAERFFQQAKISFPKLDFIKDDLENISIPSNIFDAVGCYNTLEHVRNVENVLRELIRVTKPGGFILIHSPNLLSIKHLSDALFKKSGMTFEGKKNVFQIILLFFRNIIWLLQRKIFYYSKFIYRTPNYNFTFPDNDASVFLNPLDIKIFLEKLDMEIISYQQVKHLSTSNLIKKLGSKIFADNMSIIRIVARKIYDK